MKDWRKISNLLRNYMWNFPSHFTLSIALISLIGWAIHFLSTEFFTCLRWASYLHAREFHDTMITFFFLISTSWCCECYMLIVRGMKIGYLRRMKFTLTYSLICSWELLSLSFVPNHLFLSLQKKFLDVFFVCRHHIIKNKVKVDKGKFFLFLKN
jgi:hypothetical protein